MHTYKIFNYQKSLGGSKGPTGKKEGSKGKRRVYGGPRAQRLGTRRAFGTHVPL